MGHALSSARGVSQTPARPWSAASQSRVGRDVSEPITKTALSGKITPSGPVPSGPDPGPARARRPRRLWSRPWVRVVAGVCLPLAGLAAWMYAQDYRARRHLEEARRAIEHRNFPEASRQLERFLEIRPKNAANQFLAARTARRADAYDQAQEHLTRAEQLGWDPEAVRLENVLLRAQRGELSEAVEDYLDQRTRRGLQDPEALLILEALTKTYMQKGNYVEARDCLKRWLELEPENPQTLTWGGWLWLKDSNPTRALEQLERAVQLDPENDEARLRLAEVQFRTLQAEMAIANYQRLRQRLPGQPAVLLGLASCHMELVELPEAKPLLDEVLNDGRFAEILGPSRQGRRRLPEELSPGTRAWVGQAMQLAPYDLRHPSYLPSLFVEALVGRSKIALQEDDDARAESWLRQAAQIKPVDREAILKLWQCLEKRGQLEEAQKYRAQWQRLGEQLARVKDLIPHHKFANSSLDSNVRCELAETLLALGHETAGLAWLETVLRQDPRHERARKLLADYVEQTGDPMAAGLLQSVSMTR